MPPPPKKPRSEWSKLSELNSSMQYPFAPEPMNRFRIRSSYQPVPLTFPSWNAAATYWRARRPNLSEQRLRQSLPYIFRELETGTVTWKYDAAGLLQLDAARNGPSSSRADLRHVGCPLLVIPGHNGHMDNLAEFNEALAAFLDRHR